MLYKTPETMIGYSTDELRSKIRRYEMLAREACMIVCAHPVEFYLNEMQKYQLMLNEKLMGNMEKI